MNKNLYIVRGLPGSGKSTLALSLVDGHDFLICEADKYFIDKETGEYKFDATKLRFAHDFCRNTVEQYMKDNQVNDHFYSKIAVSNTFTQEWEMKPYFELAEKYGYRVFSIVVENRHGGKDIHNVPQDALDAMEKRFQLKLI
jgi:predicted kinase